MSHLGRTLSGLEFIGLPGREHVGVCVESRGGESDDNGTVIRATCVLSRQAGCRLPRKRKGGYKPKTVWVVAAVRRARLTDQ